MTEPNAPTLDSGPASGVKEPVGHRVARYLSPANIGAVYVWLLIIVFFWWKVPVTFPTAATVQSILNNEAVTGIIAISLVVPLATGVYDLSIGYIAGFTGILSAWFLANSAMSPWTAIVLTLCAALVLGALNGLVVVVLKVNSFIGTLATGTIIFALTKWISDEKVITGRVPELSEQIARGKVLGITTPVFIMLGVMVLVGYLLEQTTTGRSWYAAGFDVEAARLAGLRVRWLQFSAFLVSALLSGLAGIVMTARVNSASPLAGPPYLLPVFAAAFVGATQFRHGRFNVWGTVVAVLMLGTGKVGLGLAGAPTWAPDVFQGVVLIAAMAITQMERTSSR
jgi:ribose transport system permease protein